MANVLVQHERSDWTDWYVARLSAEFPHHDFRGAATPDEAMAHAPETEIFVGMGPKMSPALVQAMPRLAWIQSLTTGVDNLLAMPELPKGLPITRCAGVQGPQMSELALLLMLALARRLPDMLAAQARATWDRHAQPLLHGKTACLLGLGSIAETLALYCHTLGMRVTGVSDGRAEAPHVDRVYRRAELHAAAAEADFLVVLVPLSPQTRNIVDAGVLGAMKPTAFLINIARGGCVDEAALIAALEAGTIAGAGVDVFATEPLPTGDPMWTAPNAILTPHVGGYADVYHKQCYPIVAENFRLFDAGGTAALHSAVCR